MSSASPFVFLPKFAFAAIVDDMLCNPHCKSCSHLHLSKDESLTLKLSYLQARLNPWASFIEPVRSVDDDNRMHYRDKVSLAMQFNGSTWQIGMLRRDILIPVFGCPIHTPRVNEVMNLIARYLPDNNTIPAVRFIQSGKQLTLVIKSNKLPENGWMTDEFKTAFFRAGMEGLWLHLFPSAGKKVFGKGGWHLVLGAPESKDNDGLLYGPAAFRQLLPLLADEALNEATTFLNPDIKSIVADLYCGTGGSLRKFTATGATATGVELFGESVRFAALNAPAAKVFRGTCTQRFPQLNQLLHQNPGKTRLLYANPPRTGLETGIIQWITNEYRPMRIAYLSCNALTLRNDLALLTDYGYSVNKIIPFDFFPQTRHVETLSLLTLKKKRATHNGQPSSNHQNLIH